MAYMICTKSSFENILDTLAVQFTCFYTVVLGNVTTLIFNPSGNWISVAITGGYSETSFITKQPNAIKVDGITL